MGPFFVGQIPAEPMVLTVVDASGQAIDLSDYDAAEVTIVNSSGVAVDQGDGFTAITAPLAGQVQFVWPSTSIFTVAGDYKYQLELTATGNVRDLTTTGEFVVRRSL